ncbi:MAG TPA: spore germination protein GerW family protein [Pseudobacteroides sp.]|nr:spore germination protein GerW family protein [Pseudobacteroides sp.]
MDISTLTQNVDTLFSNLENFTQNEGLIGKPVNYGNKTFLPVISVTLGYGTGNTAGKNQTGNTNNQQSGLSTNMTGGALGLGARLSTDAVLLIDNDNVSVIPVNTANTASQLVDKIPQILSGMNKQGQQGQQAVQGQQGQQNQSQNLQQQ